MKGLRIKISLIGALLALPMFSFAQIHERSQMGSRMNPEKESFSYKLGVFADTTQYQNLIEYGKTFDEGEESEDAILAATEYKNFETNVIHYLNKFDYTSLSGSMPIKLTDEKHGKYFSCPAESHIWSLREFSLNSIFFVAKSTHFFHLSLKKGGNNRIVCVYQNFQL